MPLPQPQLSDLDLACLLPPATARGVFHDGVTVAPVQYSYFTEPGFAATLLPPADTNGKSTYEVGLGCVCP